VSIKAQEFDRLISKWGLRTRNAGDLLAWFEYDGKIITRTRRSWGTLARDGYVEILRGKGLIPPLEVEAAQHPHAPPTIAPS
jgi:hypothetical protein